MGVGRRLEWYAHLGNGNLGRGGDRHLFFNEKEWGCLGGVRGMDLSAVKVFLKEVFGGFPFFGG